MRCSIELKKHFTKSLGLGRLLEMVYDETFKAGEADRLLSYLNNLIKEKRYVFRGYGKQNQLLPSIIRESEKYKDNESGLLYQLERYGSKYFSANSPIEFMSFGQHFGLPTRLLDFTYNPFIALFFALNDIKGTTGIDKDYYYILFADVGENIVVDALPLVHDNESVFLFDNAFAVKACETISLLEKKWRDKDSEFDFYLDCMMKHLVDKSITREELENRINENRILFITPNFSNERIMAQQGLFMFPYTLNEKAHLRIIEANSRRLRIDKKLRTDLLDYLDIIGFNSFHLMPDLASVCYSIKRNVVKQTESRTEADIGRLEERLEVFRILASDISLLNADDIHELEKLLDEYEKLGRTVLDSRINEAKDIIHKIISDYGEYLDDMVEREYEDSWK